jgi:CHAD domain-containing protein
MSDYSFFPMSSSQLTDVFLSVVDDPDVKHVHKLRTSIRRCEAVLHSSTYSLTAKEQQTAKRLKKVRKAAGDVRDHDIHLGLLANDEFQAPVMNGSPALLESELCAARKRAVKKLESELKKARGKRVAKKAEILCARAAKDLPNDILPATTKLLTELATTSALDHAEAVHDVRIQLKRVRYSLEAVDEKAYASLITALKRVHDALGEWHDWTTFADIAGEYLPKRSPLVIYARSKAAKLFVKGVEEAGAFLAPYRQPRKAPAAAVAARPVRARA